MGSDPRPHEPQIEELEVRRAAPVGGARGGARRWLPAVAVGGLAVAIVAAGLLGPKVPSPSPAEETPATSDRAAMTAAPEVIRTPMPAATRVPGVRYDGPIPADHFLLLGGRWVDLAAGISAQWESGCELERPFVLSGGRIVCVRQEVERPRGSGRATYDLALVTLGEAREAPADAWASPPPDPPANDQAAPAPLTTLVGRRDLVFGDPVAIALAPGAARDTLLMAWAVLDEAGYRVALDHYEVRDVPGCEPSTLQPSWTPTCTAARRTGSREILVVPAGDAAPTTLGELQVSVAPGGRAALVGVTFEGAGGGPATRRLAVADLEPAAATGRAVGPPRFLPVAVTVNASGRSPLREGDASCGGTPGEGWADDRTVYVLCPGDPPVIRRIALDDSPAGSLPPGPEAPAAGAGSGEGAELAAAVVDEIALPLRAGADPRTLLGNGVVVDAAGRYYRWSPWARTLWAADLRAPVGSQPFASSLVLPAPREIPPVAPPEDAGGPRPLLALDAARDRLYLLALGVAGSGAEVAVVRASDLALQRSRLVGEEAWATLALAPDGTLLYLATPPRGVANAVEPRRAVEVLDAPGLAPRLYAGLLPPGPWDPGAAVIAR